VVYIIHIKFKIKYFVMLYLITNVKVIFLSVHYIHVSCIQQNIHPVSLYVSANFVWNFAS